jgi:hypothetical protein
MIIDLSLINIENVLNIIKYLKLKEGFIFREIFIINERKIVEFS